MFVGAYLVCLLLIILFVIYIRLYLRHKLRYQIRIRIRNSLLTYEFKFRATLFPNLDIVKRSLHNDNFDEDSNCYKFADWHLQ